MKRAVAALSACVLGASALQAQVVPNADWRTIRTEHFAVHFTPDVEDVARRAAVYGERAYAKLGAQLVKPRGPLDLVVADNVDYSNGYTTPFPTNRIIIYAHPPLDTPALRFYDDWIELVITHELTHTFHLDRAGGWWSVAQHIFGRAPLFMPNLYEPAWVTEGLATYFESSLTGAGRVQGTYERMLLVSDLQGGRLLRPDEWNLNTSRYPGGDIAYAYGSLFFDYLARTRGPKAVGDYVERTSRATIPFLINREARKSFGLSFTDAWREWRDSLSRSAPSRALPLAGWRDLSRGGRTVVFPRWADSTSLIFTGADGKSAPSAYRAQTNGEVRAIGRRNEVNANGARRDGVIVYSQLDFTDPYHVISDLWMQRGGEETQLTFGARLSEADVRADGEIIAVHTVPGGAQLVRVSASGARITPVTTNASIDTAWAEPRWSPLGDRIAATRWTRGGFADVVVLDSAGRVIREITHDRAFDASPSWTPDGRALLFSSDRTGVSELYVVSLDAAGAAPRLLSRATTGVFFPALSPDGRTLAAVRFGVAGFTVGIAPAELTGASAPPVDRGFDPVVMEPVTKSDAPSVKYSPWRSLLPRYWLPLADQNSKGDITLGAITSGVDIVGRHAYQAQALFDLRGDEHAFFGAYEYRGLGQPVVDASIEQAWDRAGLFNNTRMYVGDLRRRARIYDLSLTMRRPRIRTSSYFSLGGELEQREYSTQPSTLLPRVNPFYRSAPNYWSALASAGWSNAQRPMLSISLEDGVSLGITGRYRWILGDSTYTSPEVIAVANGYKSLDWSGFAHHVLALRVAGGYAGGTAPSAFSIGGTSGELVMVIPGVSTGRRRTFFVRGFQPGARSGARAVAANLEYRAPLIAPNRGLGLWPAFLGKTSLALFGDAAAASDKSLSAKTWIASAGAELALDAALQYDIPYRIRLGVAAPVVNNAFYTPANVSVYLLFGSSF